MLYKIKKINCVKNEIKRAYRFYWSSRYLLYLAWLSDFSSITKEYIWILFALKSFLDPNLKDKKNILKIKSGERRNFRFYCIFTFSYVVILLFLKNDQIYLNSVFTKTLLSTCSVRWKKDFVNIVKNKVRRAQKLSIILHFYNSFGDYLIFLKNYQRYLNSVLTKRLLSAYSIRWKKKIFRIDLKGALNTQIFVPILCKQSVWLVNTIDINALTNQNDCLHKNWRQNLCV